MMTRNGLLVAALPALVMGAIAVAMLMSVGDDDSTSSSVVTNSLDPLHQFTDPYSAHMTGLAADDVVPEDFGARLGPLKKDFDLGVEEWMSRYDSWSLPD